MIENEDMELRKLIRVRKEFLDGFHAATGEYNAKLDKLQDDYLEKVTYTALNDPYLLEVRKALRAKAEKALTEPALPEPALAPNSETCPGCGEPILESAAKFCSKCAYPLEEEKMNDKTTVPSAGCRGISRRR